MDDRKGGPVQEQKCGHRASVVPVRRVEHVEVEKHLPDHGRFIALLLPANLINQVPR